MIILKKIISGGQTGADQGALEAAKQLSLLTGGWMPKNFIAEDGSHPEFLNLYNLLPHPSSRSYPPRTKLNVNSSDATLIFGKSTSPGYQLTITFCRELHKPWAIINWKSPEDLETNININRFLNFLTQHKIEILNVAGNRETSNPGIQVATKNFLIKALKCS